MQTLRDLLVGVTVLAVVPMLLFVLTTDCHSAESSPSESDS
jgi:hypothetical protein